jgi:hypothetical protein
MRMLPARLITLPAAVLALAASCTASAAPMGRHSVDEQRAADPQGTVEITNVSGRIEVVGWDKPEVEVAGTLGPNVEKLDISTVGTRTTIRVVLGRPGEDHWGINLHGPNEAELLVHVPRASSLSASLVSSSITVRELQGEQELQTVSGEVTTSAARELRVHTISGDVHVTAGPESALLELGTVSGDLDVTGGRGDVSVNTVSGDARLSLGTVSYARIKSVSGDYHVTTGLSPDGHFEAESISGQMVIEFSGRMPAAEFDLQSFSGDLKTCLGAKAVHERYGPGSRLSYREGAGTARVQVTTKSGDVSLCAQHVSDTSSLWHGGGGGLLEG